MERFVRDLTHSFRRLLRQPSFLAVAVLTLALGIGANTAIFSLVRAIILRPLPYGAPDDVVLLWKRSKTTGPTWLAIPEIASYRKEVPSLKSIAAYTETSANLTGNGEPERVAAAAVTRNMFETLRVPAAIGRSFSDDDAAAEVVVVGHDLWRRRFGADPRIVGQTISINGQGRVVIGVMPASFRLPLDFHEQHPTELWVPLDFTSATLGAWGDHSYFGVARAAPSATPEQIRKEMRAAELGWIRDGFRHDSGMVGREPVPVREIVLGDFRTALFVLVGAVLAVLLIACANVANLLLAHADDRRSELTVRVALGASRGAVIEHLLLEAGIIASLAAIVGTALAAAGVRLLAALRPGDAPLIQQVSIDGPVFAFALLLALITCVACGLVPALQASRPDVADALRESGRATTLGKTRQRTRDALTIAQIAASVMLLIGATLLVRSLVQLQHVDLGFDSRRVLTARVNLPGARYPTDSSVIDFYQRLLVRVRTLPNVQVAGAARMLPLTGTLGDWTITVEGRERRAEENVAGDWQVVTPGYLEAMRVPVQRGRSFEATDDAAHPLAAIVSETLARRYWPDADAIGKRFHLGTNSRPWITVVGIVGHVQHNTITELPRSEMYVPHAQWAAAGASEPRGMTLVLRTAADPRSVARQLPPAVHELDASLPVSDLRTLEDVVSSARGEPRFVAVLLSVFAGLALLLAMVGVYSVIALLVTRRRKDIAIRVALGARRGAVVGLVMGRGLRLAAIGVGLGLLGALALTRSLATLLYGVTPLDPLTFAAVPLLLAAVTAVASLVPANRAARLDPVEALRE